jgi:tetratricopeptide (TPR) repeat protein
MCIFALSFVLQILVLVAPSCREPKDVREAREQKEEKERSLLLALEQHCALPKFHARLSAAIREITGATASQRELRGKEGTFSVSMPAATSSDIEVLIQVHVAREIERELRDHKANLSFSLQAMVAESIALFLANEGHLLGLHGVYRQAMRAFENVEQDSATDICSANDVFHRLVLRLQWRLRSAACAEEYESRKSELIELCLRRVECPESHATLAIPDSAVYRGIGGSLPLDILIPFVFDEPEYHLRVDAGSLHSCQKSSLVFPSSTVLKMATARLAAQNSVADISTASVVVLEELKQNLLSSFALDSCASIVSNFLVAARIALALNQPTESLGFLKNAQKLLEKKSKFDASVPTWKLLLRIATAECLLAQGSVDKAAVFCSAALSSVEMQSVSADTHLRALKLMAGIETSKQNFGAVDALCQTVLSLNPRDDKAISLRAWCLSLRHFPQLVESHSLSVESAPQHLALAINSETNSSLSAEAADALQTATDMFELAQSINPREHLHFLRLGKLFFVAGREYRGKNCAQGQLLRACKVGASSAEAFAYLGHCYYLMDPNPLNASRCWKKAVDIDPACAEAGIALFSLLVAQNLRQGAEDICERAIASSAEGVAWASLRLARLQKETLRFAPAIKNFQSTLRAHPQSCVCWMELGDAYLQMGKNYPAIKASMRALEIDPGLHAAQTILISAKLALGLFDASLDVTEMRVPPRSCFLPLLKIRAEALCLRACDNLKSGAMAAASAEISDAIDILQAAATMFLNMPQSLSIFHALGSAYLLKAKIPIAISLQAARVEQILVKQLIDGQLVLFRRAISYFQKSVFLAPLASSSWLNISVACLGALDALAWRVDSDDKHRTARVFFERGLRAAKTAVRLDAKTPANWIALALFTPQAAAKQHCWIRSASNATSFQGVGHLSLYYLQRADRDLACSAFQRLQTLDPTDPTLWQVHGFFNRALHTSSAYSQACASFRRALELQPSVSARAGLGECAFAQNRNVEAVFQLGKLCESLPLHWAAFNMLGLAHERMGQLEDARCSYRRSLSILEFFDDRAECVDSARSVSQNLARVLCALGHYEQGLALFERAGFLSLHSEALLEFPSSIPPRTYERPVTNNSAFSVEINQHTSILFPPNTSRALSPSLAVAATWRVIAHAHSMSGNRTAAQIALVSALQCLCAFGAASESNYVHLLCAEQQRTEILINLAQLIFAAGDYRTAMNVLDMARLESPSETRVVCTALTMSLLVENEPGAQSQLVSLKLAALSSGAESRLAEYHLLAANVALTRRDVQRAKQELQKRIFLDPSIEARVHSLGSFLLSHDPQRSDLLLATLPRLALEPASIDDLPTFHESECPERVWIARLELSARARLETGEVDSRSAAKLCFSDPARASSWRLLQRSIHSRGRATQAPDDAALAVQLHAAISPLSHSDKSMEFADRLSLENSMSMSADALSTREQRHSLLGDIPAALCDSTLGSLISIARAKLACAESIDNIASHEFQRAAIVNAGVRGSWLEWSEMHCILDELPSALACLAVSVSFQQSASDVYHIAIWQARLAMEAQLPKLFAVATSLALEHRPHSLAALILAAMLHSRSKKWSLVESTSQVGLERVRSQRSALAVRSELHATSLDFAEAVLLRLFAQSQFVRQKDCSVAGACLSLPIV